MALDAVTDVGEWYVSEGGHDRAAREQFEGTAGMVLGRTFEGLAGFWSQQTGPWADLLNPLPKFVASRTLQGPARVERRCAPRRCGGGSLATLGLARAGVGVSKRLLGSTSYDSGVTCATSRWATTCRPKLKILATPPSAGSGE